MSVIGCRATPDRIAASAASNSWSSRSIRRALRWMRSTGRALSDERGHVVDGDQLLAVARDARPQVVRAGVLVPEAGDAVQVMKAGLLEIADVFVVNKADRDGADGRCPAYPRIERRFACERRGSRRRALSTQ